MSGLVSTNENEESLQSLNEYSYALNDNFLHIKLFNYQSPTEGEALTSRVI